MRGSRAGLGVKQPCGKGAGARHRNERPCDKDAFALHAATKGPGLLRYCVRMACAEKYASAPTVPVGLYPRFCGKAPAPMTNTLGTSQLCRNLRSEEHTLNSSHVKISYAVFCL